MQARHPPQEYIRTLVQFGSDTNEAGERERGVRYWKVAKLPRRGYWLLVEDYARGPVSDESVDSYIFASFFHLRSTFNLGDLDALRLYVHVAPGKGPNGPNAALLRVREVYATQDEMALVYVLDSGLTLLDVSVPNFPLERLTGLRRMFPVFVDSRLAARL